MKTNDKIHILKFFLMLVNSFFVILGISIFACSAWIFFDESSFISVLKTGQDVKAVAGGLFFIGIVVIVVSLLGCAGACLENRCFIIFYLSFLVVILLSQIFITSILLIRRQTIETFLRNSVDNIIRYYGGNETQTSWNLLDSVQSSAKCCGRLTSDDWWNNTVIETLEERDIYPCSCFNGTCPIIQNERFGKGSNVYKTGCETLLANWLEMNIIVIFGMDLGLLLVQILQLILGIYTYKCIDRRNRKLHPGNFLNHTEESQTDVQIPSAHTDQKGQNVAENHELYSSSVYDGDDGRSYRRSHHPQQSFIGDYEKSTSHYHDDED